MPLFYRIEIEDGRNDEGYVWLHEVPVSTPMSDIGAAIETLYPTASEIIIMITDKEDAEVQE